MENPEIIEAVSVLEPDRRDTSERFQTEYADNEFPQVFNVATSELSRWLQLGTAYFCVFLLLIFWKKAFIPLQVCLVPSLLLDTKILASNFFELQKCEQ